MEVRLYSRSTAARVQAGQQIGVVGMTGAGISEPCWAFAQFRNADPRPDFRDQPYFHYNNPNLHFAVFGQRLPKSRKPSRVFDPFGEYRELHDERGVQNYPYVIANWATWNRQSPHPPTHHSLWLP